MERVATIRHPPKLSWGCDPIGLGVYACPFDSHSAPHVKSYFACERTKRLSQSRCILANSAAVAPRRLTDCGSLPHLLLLCKWECSSASATLCQRGRLDVPWDVSVGRDARRSVGVFFNQFWAGRCCSTRRRSVEGGAEQSMHGFAGELLP